MYDATVVDMIENILYSWYGGVENRTRAHRR